jgi:hypothetical protein
VLEHGDRGDDKNVIRDAVADAAAGCGFQAAGQAGSAPRPRVLPCRPENDAVGAQRAAQIVRAGAQVLAQQGRVGARQPVDGRQLRGQRLAVARVGPTGSVCATSGQRVSDIPPNMTTGQRVEWIAGSARRA